MTGISSHELHHDIVEAGGQIDKRRDKRTSYEQQSPWELRLIEFNIHLKPRA